MYKFLNGSNYVRASPSFYLNTNRISVSEISCCVRNPRPRTDQTPSITRSQVSSVGIATSLGLNDQGTWGSIPGRGNPFLLLSTASGPAMGPTQLILRLVPRLGMVELYLHSPIRLQAWCLIKHRGNFTFTAWK
jgi:hypothetical protein